MNSQLKELMLKNGLHKYITEDCEHRMEMLYNLMVLECIKILVDHTPVIDENDSVEDWDRGYIRGFIDSVSTLEQHFNLDQ